MLLEIGKSHVALNNLMYFAKLNRIWSTLAYFWANFGQILSKPRNFSEKTPISRREISRLQFLISRREIEKCASLLDTVEKRQKILRDDFKR